jgi:GxxExxY protein
MEEETGHASIPGETERIAYKAIGCAIDVHRVLGPGFKEPIYVQAFCLELHDSGLRFEREKNVLVPYKQWWIPGHRIDLIVEETILIELKAVPKIRRLHTRQVVSYLKATNLRLGLLINFNVQILKNGIRRVVR